MRSRNCLIALSSTLLSIFCIAIFYLMQNPNHNLKLPPKVYFGKPAVERDLVIKSPAASPINLMGKWVVENINGVSVLTAQDWLEKPAVTHIEFSKKDDGEIVLTGYTGCNAFGGKAYALDGHLHAPEAVVTQRGCGGSGYPEQEIALLRIFSSPGIWETPQVLDKTAIAVGNYDVGHVQLRRMQE